MLCRAKCIGNAIKKFNLDLTEPDEYGATPLYYLEPKVFTPEMLGLELRGSFYLKIDLNP